MSGGVLQFAHQMARDEYRAPFGRERSKEASHPPDAVRVQPVEWLVEHQDRGIAQQGRGDPEPLAHPEREAPRSASRRSREANEPQNLVYPAGIQVIALREPEKVISGLASWMQPHPSSSAPTARSGVSISAYVFPFMKA